MNEMIKEVIEEFVILEDGEVELRLFVNTNCSFAIFRIYVKGERVWSSNDTILKDMFYQLNSIVKTVSIMKSV